MFSLTYLGACDAHAEANISSLEGRGIIGAIACHSNHFATVRVGFLPLLCIAWQQLVLQ